MHNINTQRTKQPIHKGQNNHIHVVHLVHEATSTKLLVVILILPSKRYNDAAYPLQFDLASTLHHQLIFQPILVLWAHRQPPWVNTSQERQFKLFRPQAAMSLIVSRSERISIFNIFQSSFRPYIITEFKRTKS